ncbi:MAG: (Fe-S)-binding protein, partial [Lacticaseibacillus sp.]
AEVLNHNVDPKRIKFHDPLPVEQEVRL